MSSGNKVEIRKHCLVFELRIQFEQNLIQTLAALDFYTPFV